MLITILQIIGIIGMLVLIFLLLMMIGFIPSKRICKFLQKHMFVQAAFGIMVFVGLFSAIISKIIVQ